LGSGERPGGGEFYTSRDPLREKYEKGGGKGSLTKGNSFSNFGETEEKSGMNRFQRNVYRTAKDDYRSPSEKGEDGTVVRAVIPATPRRMRGNHKWESNAKKVHLGVGEDVIYKSKADTLTEGARIKRAGIGGPSDRGRSPWVDVRASWKNHRGRNFL